MASEPPRGVQHELSFIVDLESLDAEPMREVTLIEAGIRERGDLQRWIESYPQIIAGDLLLVTTEFDQWQLRDCRVPDRLDVLFLDSAGSLLVAELKRDVAPDTTDLQALKYAAYCSQLTVPDIVEQYARHHGVGTDEAGAAIVEHAPVLATQELGPIRVRKILDTLGFNPGSVPGPAYWSAPSGRTLYDEAVAVEDAARSPGGVAEATG